MKATPQTDSQNVHEHGLAVWEKTKALIAGKWEGMRIPEWFRTRHVEIVNNLYPASIIKAYNIFHDCGKPFCIQYDESGRRHFPDHANVSADTYLQFFNDPDSKTVADLIRDDMVLHTATADEVAAKGWTKRHAFTLLVTSLAEVHANADMFGGIQSNSFKAKWKKLDRRGKQLIRIFCTDQYKKHSYVIVRNDLTSPQKAVQAAHVALELGRTEDIAHPSIVAVVVKNEAKLKRVAFELLEKGISCKFFRDNIYDEELTAICTEPLDPEGRQALKRFQLLQ